MRSIFAYLLVLVIRAFSHIFYRLEVKWLSEHTDDQWERVRLAVLMNHTSLYEPLFNPALPPKFLWKFISRMAAPAAADTLKRPIVGTFWKLMIPHASSISRKRDDTWVEFMENIRPDSVVVIAPEGRMKRANGLDKHGKPMTIRGGIADILAGLDAGMMVVCYSGGLHHVQAPGQFLPRIFKTIKMNLEMIDIADYKKNLPTDPKAFKLAVVADFQQKLETRCPS
jgi:hypothetical protein